MSRKRGVPKRRSLNEKMAFSSIAKQKSKSNQIAVEAPQQQADSVPSIEKLMMEMDCQPDMLHIDPIKKLHREIGYER